MYLFTIARLSLLPVLLCLAAPPPPAQEVLKAAGSGLVVAVQPSDQDASASESRIVQHSDITEVELVSGDEDDDEDEAVADSQHFFPSFAPLFSGTPLGHSRPPLFDEQPRAFSPNYRTASYPSEDTERVLGSGNFGVLRGGTYYAGSQDENAEEEYYNNGHGRPPVHRANPQPAYRHGGDFFAGFRDFADITTPPKSAYSHYYVVYANRDSSSARQGGPNNILDQLALLDSEKKVSKSKHKLNSYLSKKSHIEAKKKSKSAPKETEPLLALS